MIKVHLSKFTTFEYHKMDQVELELNVFHPALSYQPQAVDGIKVKGGRKLTFGC